MLKVKNTNNISGPCYLIITTKNLTKTLKSITREVHCVYAEFNQYGNPYDYDHSQENKQLLQFNRNFIKTLLVVVEVNNGRILPIKEWVDFIVTNFCRFLKLVVFGASDNQQNYYNSIHNDVLFVPKFNRDIIKNLQDYLNLSDGLVGTK